MLCRKRRKQTEDSILFQEKLGEKNNGGELNKRKNIISGIEIIIAFLLFILVFWGICGIAVIFLGSIGLI